MERYRVKHSFKLDTMRILMENYHDKEDKKYYDVSVGDKVSILYIDNLHNVGDDEEYVINGKVLKIEIYYDILCEECLDAGPHLFLHMDTSNFYGSEIKRIKVHNILDIHPYPYKYNLKEDPIIKPDPLTEVFMVHEIEDDQYVDMTVPNEESLVGGIKP